MSNLLVVEDDPDIAEVLRILFTRAGHTVTPAGDGRAALREAYRHRPDLVVLDVGLPELDGWAVLERLRDLTDVPVLMLTGHDAISEKVRGLRAGADDYLTKPFTNSELVARVEALLRRSGAATEWNAEPYDDGQVRVDPARREVVTDGAQVHLTPIEFRLLNVLVRNAGQVVPTSQLLTQAWDDPTGIAPSRVKFAVMRLRRKLGWADGDGSPLTAIRGVGYRYRTPADR